MILVLASCATRETSDLQARGGPGLSENWASMPPIEFESEITILQSQARPIYWSTTDRRQLTAALAGQDATAVRAAVLLAHGSGKASTEALLTRLEQRTSAPTRARDGGELVAAAAPALHPGRARVAERLTGLSVGPTPHPDLEIRVECACSALQLGREEVVPFLIRVLRALTPAELEDPGDWERTTTVAWAKTRASQALSRALEAPVEFRPDGSWEHQMEAAARFETLWSESR